MYMYMCEYKHNTLIVHDTCILLQIEGEDDDGYSQGRKRKKTTKNSIYDVYEPSELERGHFTEFDSVVRITDIPERFQVHDACPYTFIITMSLS